MKTYPADPRTFRFIISGFDLFVDLLVWWDRMHDRFEWPKYAGGHVPSRTFAARRARGEI